MRIVGGRHRGRKLTPPTDKSVRPTADRTREALFNILAHGGDYRTPAGPLPLGGDVLDVFCGSGALGLEALSRGARHVTFMDKSRDSITLASENVAALKEGDNATLVNRDATLPGRTRQPAALALLDPPYNSDLAAPALEALAEGGWLTEEAIAVIEAAAKEPVTLPKGFDLLDERRYGAAKLLFLKRAEAAT